MLPGYPTSLYNPFDTAIPPYPFLPATLMFWPYFTHRDPELYSLPFSNNQDKEEKNLSVTTAELNNAKRRLLESNALMFLAGSLLKLIETQRRRAQEEYENYPFIKKYLKQSEEIPMQKRANVNTSMPAWMFYGGMPTLDQTLQWLALAQAINTLERQERYDPFREAERRLETIQRANAVRAALQQLAQRKLDAYAKFQKIPGFEFLNENMFDYMSPQIIQETLHKIESNVLSQLLEDKTQPVPDQQLVATLKGMFPGIEQEARRFLAGKGVPFTPGTYEQLLNKAIIHLGAQKYNSLPGETKQKFDRIFPYRSFYNQSLSSILQNAQYQNLFDNMAQILGKETQNKNWLQSYLLQTSQGAWLNQPTPSPYYFNPLQMDLERTRRTLAQKLMKDLYAPLELPSDLDILANVIR